MKAPDGDYIVNGKTVTVKGGKFTCACLFFGLTVDLAEKAGRAPTCEHVQAVQRRFDKSPPNPVAVQAPPPAPKVGRGVLALPGMFGRRKLKKG